MTTTAEDLLVGKKVDSSKLESLNERLSKVDAKVRAMKISEGTESRYDRMVAKEQTMMVRKVLFVEMLLKGNEYSILCLTLYPSWEDKQEKVCKDFLKLPSAVQQIILEFCHELADEVLRKNN